MICPECEQVAHGSSADFLRVTGRCFYCGFNEWLDKRIKELKGEKTDDGGRGQDELDATSD